MTDVKLCQLDEIEDGNSAGFVIETPDDGKRSVIAVRQADRVHAYVNSCPHIGAPLDFQPGQFLNRNKTHVFNPRCAVSDQRRSVYRRAMHRQIPGAIDNENHWIRGLGGFLSQAFTFC